LKLSSAALPVAENTAAADPDPALAALLLAAGCGDQQAFAHLYDISCARVHGLVLQTICDRALAEELTERVFLKIWRTCPLFDSREGSAFGWILSVLLEQQPVPYL